MKSLLELRNSCTDLYLFHHFISSDGPTALSVFCFLGLVVLVTFMGTLTYVYWVEGGQSGRQMGSLAKLRQTAVHTFTSVIIHFMWEQ